MNYSIINNTNFSDIDAQIILIPFLSDIKKDILKNIYKKIPILQDKIIEPFKNADGSYKDFNKIAKKKGIINTLRNKNQYHFGNPFSDVQYPNTILVSNTKEAVQNYIEWILFGFKNVELERRNWILSMLESGQLKGKNVLYTNTKAQKEATITHADTLHYLINNWEDEVKFINKDIYFTKKFADFKKKANVVTLKKE